MLNETKELKITGLDHSGRGIAKIDNKIIFIANVLIGETAKVKITNVKKNYLEGELVELIEASSTRVEPKCSYFFNCGGCDLMHMPYEEQLLYKENKVKEIMKKFANIGNEIVEPIIMADNVYNYRNKVTFQVSEKVGFYQKKSYDIINVDYCMIIDEKINEIIVLIKENIDLKNIKQIIIRSSKNTNDVMIIFNIDGQIDENRIIELLKNKTTSIIKKIDNKYILINGNDYIIDYIDELKFIISPDSFFQVNTDQATKLYKKVLEYAKLNGEEKLLDLYCGTGTIGLYLSQYCKEVLGIELNQYAVKDAIKNKDLNHITNVDLKCGDVGKIINHLDFKPDVIVVDPPRSGLDTNTISQLLNFTSKKIVYVSCDPVTLARDLKILKEKYDITNIAPVDMFINTYHVECVVKLVRRNLGE